MDIRPLLFSCFSRKNGSAIIGALVLCGILAMAVGVMLSSTNTAIRRSADKITYEQAYQSALAGTHVARAWLINPDLAESMSGNGSIKSSLADIVSKATTMNQEIAAQVEQRLRSNQSLNGLNLEGPSQKTWFQNVGKFALGSALSDGRHVIYNFPASPVVSLINDPDAEQFNDDLFSTPEDGNKTYVEWLRITTPGTTAQTAASLRECTFIVEAKGVTEIGGKKKERVVQQRVLIKPNKAAAPLLGATEAIITDGTFSTQAMSSGNVHWGPVLARRDIANPFFEAMAQRFSGNGNNKKFDGWSFNIKQIQKANMAGLFAGESGNNKGGAAGVLDKWLHWRTGTNGRLYAGHKGEEYMFEGIPNVPASGEFDFFKELMSGTLNTGSTPVNVNNFELDPAFKTAGTSLKDGTFNGLVSFENGQYTSGALVQGSPAVDDRIDEFFSSMNYEKLKTYAQSHNSYYTWDGSTLRNAAGTAVDTPSMSPGNTDTLAANAAPDRMLFIDSIHGNEQQPFTKAIQLPSFWKGIVYVNGPIYTSGAGSSPDIYIRSPEQFQEYRESGSSGRQSAKGVFVDGIVVCNGTADLGANGAIYGTLAARGGVITGANFSVFYNAANAEGRLRDTSTGAQPFGLIAGRLYEVEVPNS